MLLLKTHRSNDTGGPVPPTQGVDMPTAIAAFVGVLGIAVFLSFLFSWPVMMLWNGCLVGAVSGVSEITWLQAWGLAILCNILFKATASKAKD